LETDAPRPYENPRALLYSWMSFLDTYDQDAEKYQFSQGMQN